MKYLQYKPAAWKAVEDKLDEFRKEILEKQEGACTNDPENEGEGAFAVQEMSCSMASMKR